MTINEIAKKAGVAKSTVSYVLNGTKKVSPKTREKILKVCEKYNFQPNFYSKLLSNKRGNFKTNLIALFLPLESNKFHYFYSELISSMFTNLENKGYGLILYSSRDFASVVNKLSLGQAPIDGAIVMSPIIDDERVLSLSNAQIPLVIIGNGERYNMHYVDTNNKSLAKDIAIKMIEKGFDKIALINSLEKLTISQDRNTGFIEAYQEKGIEPACDCYYYDDSNEEQLFGYALQSIDKGINAFITSNGRVAMTIYKACKSKGKTIGKDVAIFSLGFSQDIDKKTIKPSLSFASQNYIEIGELSTNMLTRLINEEEPSNILVESVLHFNESFDY